MTDPAQRERPVEPDVLAPYRLEHARLEVLGRQREVRPDAGLAQRQHDLEVALGGVLRQVKEHVARAADGRPQSPDLADDVQVPPAHAVVGVDDVEVRDLPPRDPVELAVQARQRQLAHLALHGLAPVAERTGERASPVGLDDGGGGRGVRRHEAVEGAVEVGRGRLGEVGHACAGRGEHRALGPRGRAEGEAGDAVERPPSEERPEHLAEEQLALAKRERVDVRVLAQEASRAVGPPGHRRAPEEHEGAGPSRPRAPGDLEREALVPRVRREREHVGPLVTPRHRVGIEPCGVDGQGGRRGDRRVSPRRGHEESRRQRQGGDRRDAFELVNDDVHRRPPHPRLAAR